MSDYFSNSVDDAFAVVGNSGQARFAEQNKGVTPIFFFEDVQDDAATEKAGTLRMRQEERVRLFTVGDPNSSPVHPITPEIKQRFAAAYKEWQQTRKNDHIEGVPLSVWPLVTRAFVMELNALHIRSVEDLSIASDMTIARIVDGRVWRDKAKAWLEANKDAGAAAKYAAEASRLRDDNAELKRQLAELAGRVQALEGDGGGSHRGGKRAA